MEFDIVNLIGSLGFPIFMSIMLMLDMKEERKMHREEVKELSKVIEKNTEVLIEIRSDINESENV